MTYHHKAGVIIPFIIKFYKQMIVVVAALFLASMASMTLSANASSTLTITNVAELRVAIENQTDGETWNIQAGEYGLEAFSGITVSGQTGWYFPITANNLTINGFGNPTIYGTGYTANGNWATQNLVSVFGDNVTIDGLTLMPKIEPNKTVEVLGSDFTLTNTTFLPNSLTDASEYASAWAGADQWGGSLYFSHEGNHTIENVTINNSGISFRNAPSGTNIFFNNVTLKYETDLDWINQYRYSSAFNNGGNSTTGVIDVVYHVNSSLNNLDVVLDSIKDGDNIELDSNITTNKQITLNKTVSFNGNGNTIDSAFAKTTNSNNSAVSLQADNISIVNLTVDGQNGTDLHGINMYEVAGVILENVTSNNYRSGIALNSSTATLRNISTSGNVWHGINVDTKTAQIAGLTIENTSSHDENSPSPPSSFIDGVHVSHIFIDDATDGSSVNDVDNQYDVAEVDFRGGRALVYTLKIPDTTRPTAEFITPNGEVYTNSVNVELKMTDLDSGLNNMVVNIYNNTNTLLGTCGTASGLAGASEHTLSCVIDVSGYADGTYTLKGGGFDVAGNNKTVSTTFVVDKNSPEVNGVVLNGQNVYLADVRSANCEPVVNFYNVNGEIDLSATITDSVGDVQSAKYRVRKVSSNGCTQSSVFSSGFVNMANTTGDTWEDVLGFDTTNVPFDGEYTIFLQTTDSNGNTTTKYIDILVDNTAPAQVLGMQNRQGHTGSSPLLGCNGYTSTTQIRIEWNASPEADIDYYWFGTRNNPYHRKVQAGTEFYNGNMTVNSNPEYFYTIIPVDKSGNEGPISEMCYVTLDLENPEIEITSVSENPITAEFTIEGTASDNEGLRPLRISFRSFDGTVGPVIRTFFTDVLPNGTWSLTIDTLDYPELVDGDYRIVARANDLTGNNYATSNTAADTEDVEIDNSITALVGGGGQVAGVFTETPNNLDKETNTDENQGGNVLSATDEQSGQVLADTDTLAIAGESMLAEILITLTLLSVTGMLYVVVKPQK